ncbi:hypothetical protein, partial [Armatimonas sp.]|uniref:hypothetical protein n=1 Tax=Armatimonas sp. TaxID=1872638 RepID=UPI003751248E
MSDSDEEVVLIRSTLKPVRSKQGIALDLEAGVDRLEHEMERTRRAGLLGLARLKWEAWLEERMQGPAVRKLKAQQALLDEQRKTAESQIRLKATIQGGERDAERGRIEYNQVLWHRLQTDLEHSGILIPGSTQASPMMVGSPSNQPVSVHITDEQIEALALRAVMGISKGEGSEAEWEQYRAQ